MTDPTPLGHGADDTPVLKVRSPEDLLALAAVMLGFVPEDSVAMLTFGGAQAFHARTDLPREPGDLPEVVDSLLEPARRHRVAQAAFVVYSDSEFVGRRLSTALVTRFEAAGVHVIEVLRADGSRWFPTLARGRAPEWGVPYDISAHPFVAEAVLRGQITHGSREALASSVRPDPEAQCETARVVESQGPPWRQSEPPPVSDILREGAWVEGLVSEHAGAGTVPGDEDVARLLRVIQLKRVRDAAWAAITRPGAKGHADLWAAIVRRTPDDLLAPAATLLGWSAWQAGHGALAWCAHDLATGVDPAYTMARQLGHALEHAIPPSAWDGPWDWKEGLA